MKFCRFLCINRAGHYDRQCEKYINDPQDIIQFILAIIYSIAIIFDYNYCLLQHVSLELQGEQHGESYGQHVYY